MFQLDELSLALSVAILLIAAYLGLRRSPYPDVAWSRVFNQSEPSLTRKTGESEVRRSFAFKENLTKFPDGTDTLYAAFQRGHSIDSGTLPCLGYRPTPNAPYVWLSYIEVRQRIAKVGSGLIHVGVQPKDTVGIFADNRVEWTLTEQACNAFSFISVALYNTLGPDVVGYIIRQSEIALAVVAENHLANILKNAADYPCLKIVVKMGSAPVTEEETRLAESAKIKLINFRELEVLGESNPHPLNPAKPSDVATICWTSGTTDLPKGVVLTHENIMSSVVASIFSLPEFLRPTKNEVHLSYLPLAPISKDVIEFLRVVFGCQVIEGYGQTENGGCTGNIYGDYTGGSVGIPFPHCKVKLVDVPEMGYFATDKPSPRGEICVYGPNVFKGYHKDPEKTKEVLDDDGWMHSGDIGMFLPSGALRIIDRKKHIFKLSQGEYVAPEKIENVYQKSRFVEQIFVHGDSLQTTLVGIIVPEPEQLAGLAAAEGISGNHQELTKNPQLQRKILEDLKEHAKRGKLLGFEQVREFHFEPTPFSVENGLLTPTFKSKRAEIVKKYRKVFDDLYSRIEQ